MILRHLNSGILDFSLFYALNGLSPAVHYIKRDHQHSSEEQQQPSHGRSGERCGHSRVRVLLSSALRLARGAGEGKLKECFFLLQKFK